MKKKIIFVADSSVDLIELYNQLNIKFDVIWVVYHKNVYEILKESNIKSIYLINLSFKFLEKNFFIIKIIKFALNFFKINFQNFHLHNFLKKMESKYSPVLMVTDTVNLLADYKTDIIKISLKHSVPYKKFYLQKNNLKYDYIYFPGNYHLERFKKFYDHKNDSKFLVTGNIKISYFIKNKEFDKNNLLNTLGLEKNKINVTFAPSWNAHGKDFLEKFRFLPKSFENQTKAIKVLADQLKNENCNFIIKLHHYSYSYLKNKITKEKYNNQNCYIFNSGNHYDRKESNEIFMLSDIIITDVSGVATTGIFLDKKIIFLNPEQNFDWTVADIEKKYRPGFVCNSLEETIDSVKKYIKNSDPFIEDRKKFVDKMFYKPHEDANKNIAKHIEDITK